MKNHESNVRLEGLSFKASGFWGLRLRFLGLRVLDATSAKHEAPAGVAMNDRLRATQHTSTSGLRLFEYSPRVSVCLGTLGL